MSDSDVLTERDSLIFAYDDLLGDRDWLVFCKCFISFYSCRNECKNLSPLYFNEIIHIDAKIRDMCSDIKKNPSYYKNVGGSNKLHPSKATHILNVLLNPMNYSSELPPLIRQGQHVDMYNTMTLYYAPTEALLHIFNTNRECYQFPYTEESPMYREWVYCFYNPDSELTKIGVTSDYERRKQDLERASGSVLEVLYVTKCVEYLYLEKLLHSYFAQYRKKGEWFLLPKRYNRDISEIFNTVILENSLISYTKEEIDNEH